ncbi:MAG: hypothetical protein F6K19_47300 [Cyanothece sp. SIO1E1]|nr:hypothetical protein [Cyanothece sp. SIO1E1]
MTTPCRSCWCNCALVADTEISAIDNLEDNLAPLDKNVLKIRELISSLELCHHKADRWVENIIQAIGEGKTSKGLGTRTPGQLHSSELIWKNAINVLSDWLAGVPSSTSPLTIGSIPSSTLIASLGERNPLKEWQVLRVMDKIRESVHWPLAQENPHKKYQWMILVEDNSEVTYRRECPSYFKSQEAFWRSTVETFIHDQEYQKDAKLSLGLAIDMLWPCHWNFPENLKIVLQAIGGNLHPTQAFAACGRNLTPLPIQDRLEVICHTLKSFMGEPVADTAVDRRILEQLGEATEVKRWLVASLLKTIQLQLRPQAEIKAACSLAGPDWLNV